MKKRLGSLGGHNLTRHLGILCLISSILMVTGCRTLAMEMALNETPQIAASSLNGRNFDSIVLSDVLKDEVKNVYEWDSPFYYECLMRAGFIQYVRAKRIVCKEDEKSLHEMLSQGMTQCAFPIEEWWRSDQMRAFVLENLKAITSLEDYCEFDHLMRQVQSSWVYEWESNKSYIDSNMDAELQRVLEVVYQEKLKFLQSGEIEKFKQHCYDGDSINDDWKLMEATLLVNNNPDRLKEMIALWEDKLKEEFEDKYHIHSEKNQKIQKLYKQLLQCVDETLIKTLQTSTSAKEKSVRQAAVKEFNAWLSFWKKYNWLDISPCYPKCYALTLGKVAKAKNAKTFLSWMKYWEKACPEVLHAREESDTGCRNHYGDWLCREKPSRLLDLDLIRLHLNDEYNSRCEYSQWNIQEFVKVDPDLSVGNRERESKVGVPVSLAREVVVAIEADNVELLRQHLQMKDVSYSVTDGYYRTTRKIAKNALELGVQVGDSNHSRGVVRYALECGSIEVADWLYENGAELPKANHISYEKPAHVIKCVDWLIANSIEKEISTTAFETAICEGYVKAAELIRKRYGLKLKKSYVDYLKSCEKPVDVVEYLSATCGLKIKDHEIGQLLALRKDKEWDYRELPVEVFAKLLMLDGVDVNGYAQKNFELDRLQISEISRRYCDRNLHGFADYLETIGLSAEEANKVEEDLRAKFAEKDESDAEVGGMLSMGGAMGAAFAAGAREGKEKYKRNLIAEKLTAIVERLESAKKLKPNTFKFDKVEIPLLFAVVETFGDEAESLVESMIKRKVSLPCVKKHGDKRTELKEYAQKHGESCRKVLIMLRKAERAR